MKTRAHRQFFVTFSEVRLRENLSAVLELLRANGRTGRALLTGSNKALSSVHTALC